LSVLRTNKELKDTTEVIRIRKSKDRLHDGQMKIDKRQIHTMFNNSQPSHGVDFNLTNGNP
jgi:hypothetical protein